MRLHLIVAGLAGSAYAQVNATAATTFALEYGYPLAAYAKVASALLTAGVGTNKLFPSLNLSTPTSTAVVAPNVDTLYSAAVIDLSAGNLNLTVPFVDLNRYWSASFYDPFGSDFAVIGSVTNATKGNYTVSWTPPGSSANSTWPVQGGAGLKIPSPAAYGILLIRVLVKNNTTDLASARTIINGFSLSKVSTASTGVAPLSASTFSNITFTSPLTGAANAAAILQLTARTLPGLPVYNSSNPASVISQLAAAGVTNGTYNAVSSVNLTTANTAGFAALLAYQNIGFQSLGNGWARSTPQGLYGDNYTARAYAANAVYLENLRNESLYPTYLPGGVAANWSLASNQSYLFTLTPPPLGPSGFWSFTLYNTSNFLVANPANIYTVGDRSNVTYSNGTLVYGSTGKATGNTTFQILVQTNTPAANWTHNWLPAPANSVPFNVVLRLYNPTTATTNGSWAFPVVVKGASK